MKLNDPDLEELAMRTDAPRIRLDEHDRCCHWCSFRAPSRCMRAKVLLRAIELVGERIDEMIEVKRDPDNGAGLTAVFFCGTPLHHFNDKQKTDAYIERLRRAVVSARRHDL